MLLSKDNYNFDDENCLNHYHDDYDQVVDEPLIPLASEDSDLGDGGDFESFSGNFEPFFGKLFRHFFLPFLLKAFQAFFSSFFIESISGIFLPFLLKALQAIFPLFYWKLFRQFFLPFLMKAFQALFFLFY